MIIGHRGSSYLLENTLESILHAIDIGVNGIEIDIRTCKSGEPIVFHDDDLFRLGFKDNNYFRRLKKKKIHQLNWNDLYNTEIIDSLGKKYKIPKLVHILNNQKVIDSDILINLEIKDEESKYSVSDLLLELFQENRYDPSRFLISSYSIDTVEYFKELKQTEEFKQIKIGLISDDYISSYPSINYLILDKQHRNKTPKNKPPETETIWFTVNQIEGFENQNIITDYPYTFLN